MTDDVDKLFRGVDWVENNNYTRCREELGRCMVLREELLEALEKVCQSFETWRLKGNGEQSKNYNMLISHLVDARVAIAKAKASKS